MTLPARVLVRSAIAVVLVTAAACAGSEDSASSTTQGVGSTGATSAPVAETSSPAPPTDTTVTNDAVAAAPPGSTVAPDTTLPATTAPVGPPSVQLVVPGDQAFFDAIGADVVRVEIESADVSAVAVVGRDGNGYQRWQEEAGERVVWMQDRRLYRDVEGLLEPVLFPGGTLSFVLGARVGFPERDLLALVTARDEIELTDGPGRRFAADPDELLEFQRGNHPGGWLWESASVEATGNHAGALRSYRATARYTVVPPPDMIDPPPPRDVDEDVAITLLPTTERDGFPTARLHPDADDLLARALLERAVVIHSRWIERIHFGGGDIRPVTVDDLNDDVVEGFPPQFDLSFGTIDQAGGSMIGYRDDVLVIESGSGRWFCQLGRRDITESADPDARGRGSSAVAAWEACRSLRS